MQPHKNESIRNRNIGRTITSYEIQSVIQKQNPPNKSPGQDGFIGEFYQTEDT